MPLIAETGGINAMIVDATALPEQVTDDVIASAFRSAGQRCSALRLLCVQEDVADRMHRDDRGRGARARASAIRAMLATACRPGDRRARRKDKLDALDRRAWRAAVRFRCDDGARRRRGTFVAPTHHRARPRARSHARRCSARSCMWCAGAPTSSTGCSTTSPRTGYGLTLGIHSRIDDDRRAHRARGSRNGNVYVNRNMIGAVVGTQPFGGSGLSGTGPKAGGPHYLRRFATEQMVTVNTAAAGGNASLLAEGE